MKKRRKVKARAPLARGKKARKKATAPVLKVDAPVLPPPSASVPPHPSAPRPVPRDHTFRLWWWTTCLTPTSPPMAMTGWWTRCVCCPPATAKYLYDAGASERGRRWWQLFRFYRARNGPKSRLRAVLGRVLGA